jgi:hypothetical protein
MKNRYFLGESSMVIRKGALILAALSLSCTAWSAPSLTVGKVTGKPGTEAVLPISLDPSGAKVSAVQFSLILPKDLTGVSVTLGSTGSSASKLVNAKQQGDHWNIIIMGMNQTTMDAGVLANATVKISPTAKPAKLSVTVENTVYSDGAGRAISGGSSKGGSVKVSTEVPSKSS